MTTSVQLWELQKVCNVYKATDCLADWVLFAVTRYINTGRATRQYEKDFCSLSKNQLLEMVKYCLNHDKSDDGIIKNTKKFFRKIV